MRKAYASLATLVRRGQDAGGHGTLTPDTEAEVLAWCRRYGLLGILLQRVEQVVLPPWTEVETALLREETDTEELEQYQIQVQFRRNPMGWQKMRTQDVIGDGELPSHDPAGVTLHAIDALETVCEPFGKTWARFFPAVPAINASPIHIRRRCLRSFGRSTKNRLRTSFARRRNSHES